MDYFLHEKAYVENGAIIGEGSKVWVNSQVRNGSVIGMSCILGKDTFIDAGVVIGDRVKIQNGVSVYNGVQICDDVFVGPNVVFTNDMVPRAFNVDWKITKTVILEGASIGANSTIVCGITIGKYAMIGAGSVVTHDVPDHALVFGNPARIRAYVCKCGEKLDQENYCLKCKCAYKLENRITK